jgi:hypothetical protein
MLPIIEAIENIASPTVQNSLPDEVLIKAINSVVNFLTSLPAFDSIIFCTA